MVKKHTSRASHLPQRSGRRRLAPWVATSFLSLAPVSQGGQVTLEGLGDTNQDIPVNHGSNADVTLTWPDTWDQYTDWNGRGDVYQVDQPVVTLDFTPTSPAISITIVSFDLDEWAGGGNTAAQWSVEGPESGRIAFDYWNVFDSGNDPDDLGGRSTIDIAATGKPGEKLTLTIDHLNLGAVSYLALDNLTFLTTGGVVVGDLNSDGSVDASDAGLLFANWGQSGVGDFNNDGLVDAADAGEMFANWTGDARPVAIPEPASRLVLWQGIVGLGVIAMRRARRT